jgi:hypothetical protein
VAENKQKDEWQRLTQKDITQLQQVRACIEILM